MNNSKTAYFLDGNGGGSGVITGSSTWALGFISRDKLEPIEPPKVIPEPPLTLDQQVARAQSIVRVTIEAQYEWDKLQIAKGFAEAKNRLIRIPDYVYALWGPNPNLHGLKGNLQSLLDEVRLAAKVRAVRNSESKLEGGTLSDAVIRNRKSSMSQPPTKYLRREKTQAEESLAPTQVWELSIDNPNSSISKFLKVFDKHHGS